MLCVSIEMQSCACERLKLDFGMLLANCSLAAAAVCWAATGEMATNVSALQMS